MRESDSHIDCQKVAHCHYANPQCVPMKGLEPLCVFQQLPLKQSCLTNFTTSVNIIGAEYGPRFHNLGLGKTTLYQLS